MDYVNWSEIESNINQKDADWKKREESLQILVDRLSKKDKHVVDFVNKNAKGIALQLNDLRSAIVKLAALIVEKAAVNVEAMGSVSLEKFTEVLLRDANMIKALGSANKVINIHASSAFRALLKHNQVNLSTLETLFAANKDNKNINIRERVAEGFLLYVSNLQQGKTKPSRPDWESYLRKNLDVLIKDASANVRNFAKSAKTTLDSTYQLSNTAINVKIGSKEDFKSVKHNTMPLESYKQNSGINNTLEQKKTVPILKKGKVKGVEIENDETLETKTSKLENSKKGVKKLISAKITDIIDLLNDSRKQPKERVDELNNYNLNYASANCTGHEYKKLLKQISLVKNSEIKNIYQKLIIEVSIGKFIGEVLNYTETEKLDSKETYDFFIDKLLKEDISSFIDYFLLRNNSFSLKMLLDRFDFDDFEEYIAENPDIVPSIISAINLNLTENESDMFLNYNVHLLESIFQSRMVILQYKNYEFSKICLNKLAQLNPGMHKFFVNQQKTKAEKNFIKDRSRERNVVTPKTNTEQPIRNNEEQAISNKQGFKGLNQNSAKKRVSPNKVNSRENLSTLIDSLADSIKLMSANEIRSSLEAIERNMNIQCPKQEDLNNKALKKGLLIIEDFLNDREADEGIIISVYKFIDKVFMLCTDKDYAYSDPLHTLFQIIVSQPYHKDRLAAMTVNGPMRMHFYTYVLSTLENNDSKLIINGLRILISMIKYGKKSQKYLILHKDVANSILDLINIMKRLFIHQEVGVRKNAVQFLAECYFFMDHDLYPKIYNVFAPEQQKLIEIYIKKVETQP